MPKLTPLGESKRKVDLFGLFDKTTDVPNGFKFLIRTDRYRNLLMCAMTLQNALDRKLPYENRYSTHLTHDEVARAKQAIADILEDSHA